MHLDFGGIAFEQQGDGMPSGRSGMNVKRQIQFSCQVDETFEDFFLKFLVGFFFHYPEI